MIWAELRLIPYLEGSHSIIMTNHQALRWIPDLKTFTGQLAGRRLWSTEFYFEIVHWPDKYHEAADTMSSLPQKATDKTQGSADVDDDISTYCIAGQVSKPNTVLKEYEDEVGPLPPRRN